MQIYVTLSILLILLLSISASTGSVTSEAKSVTSPVTSTKKAAFGGLEGKEVVIFFNQTC